MSLLLYEPVDPARLADLRRRAGLSRERLAAEAGLSVRTVARMERGELPRGSAPMSLAAVADALQPYLLPRQAPRTKAEASLAIEAYLTGRPGVSASVRHIVAELDGRR